MSPSLRSPLALLGAAALALAAVLAVVLGEGPGPPEPVRGPTSGAPGAPTRAAPEAAPEGSARTPAPRAAAAPLPEPAGRTGGEHLGPCALVVDLVPGEAAELPASATVVLARRDELGALVEVERRTVRADEPRTRFAALSPGVWRVEARADGLLAASAETLLGVGSSAQTLVLRLELPAHLVGALVDGGGAGAADVPLLLVDGGGAVVARTTTDPVGRFRFDPVGVGSYRLDAGSLGATVARPRVPPAGLDLGALVVDGSFVLALAVVDEDGVGIPGVELRGAGSAGASFGVVTDHDGRATAHLVHAGRYRVRGTARTPGYATGPVFAVAEVGGDGPTRTELVLTVRP